MHHRIITRTTLAIALLLAASLSMAADKKPEASGATTGVAKTSEPTVKAKAPVAAAKKAKSATPASVKLVDINSANKAALMKLPGVGEPEAAKIIAGRPYLTKTRLVTKNIISMGLYQEIKKMVIAKQK